MTPEVSAPSPLVDPPTIPVGSLDDFLGQIETTAESAPPAGMTCTIKGAGTQSVTLFQPSAVIKKNSITVKTNKDSTKSGKLTFQTTGKESSMFTGTSKNGNFSVKLVIEGTVVEI